MAWLSKADFVAEELQRMINDGELAPGTVLRQRTLAQEFGVSATPVREALQRLEALGFISNELHKGSSVVRHDAERDRENSRIRAVLEPLAAAWAAEIRTDQDLADIRALHEEFAASIGTDQMSNANRRFHMRIYEAAGSSVLLDLIRQLWSAYRLTADSDHARNISVPEHAALVDALERQDAAGAARLMREHVIGAMRYIPQHDATAPAEAMSSYVPTIEETLG
jgi:DNA-binding GntR family transcriptional regulator